MKDAWGLAAIRVTFKDHPNDIRLEEYMRDRDDGMLRAAGATSTTPQRVSDDPGAGFHLLGHLPHGERSRARCGE